MSVTEEERALIDAAVAAGRVRRIDRGVTGLGPVVWDPKVKSLRYVDPSEGQRALRGSVTGLPSRKPRAHQVPDRIVQRRRRIAELVKDGRDGPSICAVLGITRGVLDGDLRKLGLNLTEHRVVPDAPRPVPDGVLERRARVKAAFDGRKSVTQLAEDLGIPRRGVLDCLKALGLKAPDGRAARKGKVTRAVRARRELVSVLVEKPMTQAQIAELIGVSKSTIVADLEAIAASARAAGGS